MNKFYLSLSIVLAIVISSCGGMRIEKRHYRNGFYVNTGGSAGNTGSSTATPAAAVVEKQNPSSTQEKTSETLPAPASSSAEQPAGTSSPGVVATPEQTSPVEPAVKPASDQPAEQGRDFEQTKTGSSAPAPDDTMLIILIILAIIIPPLAVFLKEGLTPRFWLTLILAILGGGFFFYPVIGGLYLLAIILALLIVFDVM